MLIKKLLCRIKRFYYKIKFIKTFLCVQNNVEFRLVLFLHIIKDNRMGVFFPIIEKGKIYTNCLKGILNSFSLSIVYMILFFFFKNVRKMSHDFYLWELGVGGGLPKGVGSTCWYSLFNKMWKVKSCSGVRRLKKYLFPLKIWIKNCPKITILPKDLILES